MKNFFLNHLVYTSSNLKKILILLVINILGISTILGIPVVVIFDLAFIYYNLNRIFKNQGGIGFLLKINDILWLFLLLAIVFFIMRAIV
ncbi:hypothetical protein D7V32_01420 [Acinetobacter tianfuensis]|uniref:Uncharacterized protein n=1 Tax=Acinetobacter tianfuensis TaxID=2419603 RepID=A0A3A8F0U2_9GAMM|nr:hypothetical protein D7V32_01420 [Acinetobacter tianfuensis]